MKKLILSLCFIITSLFSTLNAQEVKANTQLHFKNGELITGTIVSRDDQKVVITNVDDGIKYEYSVDDIAYITHAKKKKNYNSSRFRGMIDVAYAFGVGTPRDNVFGVETSFGYQFNHYLYLGAGIAVNFHTPVSGTYPYRLDGANGSTKYSEPRYRFPFVPVYVNIRSQLYEGNRITPYLDLKVGASVINNIGFYASPAIGIHFPTRSNVAFNFGVGYTIQQSEYKLWVPGSTPGAIIDGDGGAFIWKRPLITALTIRAGIEF